MSDFAFRIIADIKGYHAELMKIPGATEKSAFAAAQRMALTMEKGGRDAGQKAGKELVTGIRESAPAVATATKSVMASASGAMRAGGVNLANQASDVLTQISTGTSPLTVLIQQGPQVAGALDMMGVAFSSLLTIALPVTLAIGAMSWEWSRLNAELAAVEARNAAAAESSKKLADAVTVVRDEQAKLADKLALAEGRVTQSQLDQRDAVGRVVDQYGPLISARRTALKTAQDELTALYATIEGEKQRTGQDELRVDLAEELYGKRDRLVKQIENEAAQLVNLGTAQAVATNRATASIQATDAAVKAAKALEDALRRLREEEQARAAALAAIVHGYGQWKQAVGQLAEMETRASTSTLTGIEAVEAARVESLQRAQALAREADKGAGASAKRRAETERQLAETIVAINEEAAAKKAKIREDEAKAAEKEAERIRALQYAAADRALSEVTALTEQAYSQRLAAADRTNQALRDGYGELTRAETEQLQRRLQGQRRAALAWWVANKATALAQGVVNTQLAVSNALASAPPPFNAALAIAAGIAGAAQVAQIAAAPPPSFHRGTQGASSRRDEFAATLERGEAVIPKSAAQDPRNQDAIARMRGDRMSAGPTVVAVDRYDGRAFGRGIRDQLRAGGYLRRAIASTNPHLGHR